MKKRHKQLSRHRTVKGLYGNTEGHRKIIRLIALAVFFCGLKFDVFSFFVVDWGSYKMGVNSTSKYAVLIQFADRFLRKGGC